MVEFRDDLNARDTAASDVQTATDKVLPTGAPTVRLTANPYGLCTTKSNININISRDTLDDGTGTFTTDVGTMRTSRCGSNPVISLPLTISSVSLTPVGGDGTGSTVEASRGPSSISICAPSGLGLHTHAEIHENNIEIHLSDPASPPRISAVPTKSRFAFFRPSKTCTEMTYLNGPTTAELTSIRDEMQSRKENLGEWRAFSICGNDILSNVLFTGGLTTACAGKYAPLAELIVIVVVYCFRFVMEEVMSAIPLNGGVYNAILNASSKKMAATAAIFSVLAYLAGGVICGVAAFGYLNNLTYFPIAESSVGMMFVFAVLCLFGIGESSMVALIFLVFHLLVLSVLAVYSIVFWAKNPHIFVDNMTSTSIPNVSIGGSVIKGSVTTALFMGFGIGMLGVSGFDQSSQFIEDQAPGVYPKTLRNMWLSSSVYNLLFSVLSLAVLPLDVIYEKQDVLLAYMGKLTAGRWLEIAVCIDAFVVLAGAVLACYIGIIGVIERLATDHVFPMILVQRNKWRHTMHWIILAYFVLASSLVLALDGDIHTLANVTTFAFYGVMASFAVACILLKLNRREIPRETVTSWGNVVFCLVMVLAGFLANALIDPDSFAWFVVYFGIVGVIMMLMLIRIRLLNRLLICFMRLCRSSSPPVDARVMAVGNNVGNHPRRPSLTVQRVTRTMEKILGIPVVFFCKHPNWIIINEAVRYVLANEQSTNLRLIHIAPLDDVSVQEFKEVGLLFDHIYPDLQIDFISITGHFDPAIVQWISRTMNIPTNMMLMRQPCTKELHNVVKTGVRVIGT